MLGYGPEEWRSLPWWQRRAYISGFEWEFERGGLNPHPDVTRASEGGGESGQQFVPVDSMAERARLGITVVN